MDQQPRVIVVGAGFGGLYAAKALRNAAVEVLVVDRRNHHLFQPLLYQVATAALSAPDIARPIRSILKRQDNATVILGEVRSIDLERQCIGLDGGEYAYDSLILATGTRGSYFGHEEWAPHAPPLKTLGDAFEMRRRILGAFEAAEREPDPERRKPWQTFVIVGAGPTGVELAGALREIATKTLARDFRHTDVQATRVVLVDAVDRVLAQFPAELSRKAQAMLERSGVEVRLGARVTDIDELGVQLGREGTEERIEARTTFWAAGVRGSSLAGDLDCEHTPDGRVLVAPDLSVPGRPEVFVIGDLAAVRQSSGPQAGDWVPGMAPGAIQMGRHAAANVERLLRHQPTEPFAYRDRGLLATIGRSAAVARIGRFHFGGFFAWVLWLVVHIAWLIGFRNRLAVFFEWAWAYLTYQRSARVVVDPPSGQTEHP